MLINSWSLDFSIKFVYSVNDIVDTFDKQQMSLISRVNNKTVKSFRVLGFIKRYICHSGNTNAIIIVLFLNS